MRQVLPTEQRLDKAMRGKQESTTKHLESLSLKFWVGQALKQALKQESKIVWICEQCEHHANIMRTRWAVLVLPVVRPIGGYHCRLHPALRRDLPNLAPVHRDKPFGDLRRGTWMNLDELCLQSVTYCDYYICILCYNLITTGTLAPRSPFRICGAHCFSIFLHALRFLARSCCVTCSSEKASGRETVQKVRSFRKKDCTCFNTEELHGICEMFQV